VSACGASREGKRRAALLRAFLAVSSGWTFVFLTKAAARGAPKRKKMRARAISVNFACVGTIFNLFRSLVSHFQSRFFSLQQKIKFRFFLVDVAAGF
jgi:sorbitol-specific phosphotransferase system component IIC